ncbi:MAG TPA: glycoside hydrolase family 88 protein [Chitinophagaceae bacterium]
MRVVISYLISAFFVTAAGCTASRKPATSYFSDFSAGTSPQEIGNLVAKRFLEVPHPNFGRPEPPVRISYPEICSWYGALTFANVTNNKILLNDLAKRFEPLFTTEAKLVPVPDHVDHTVFAAVPLELYVQTSDIRYLNMGRPMADTQWAKPWSNRANALSWHYYNKGMTWQTRMWIDDMFMITAAQAQAYRATGNRNYIDRAAREMVLYLDSLQKPNGLFYHAPDVPFFWGRGNGWMAAGMSELLRSLPKDNPDRPRIMEGYKTMMASLLKYQADDGMWRQLIDDAGSWPETSCTGMFTFAMITGVKEGWLDATSYGPAARKAWLALISYINPNGDIREVCQGTNKKNDRQYYLDRQRLTGDMHGQAPVLWCATALLR